MKKVISLIILAIVVMGISVACKPFDKPNVVTIEPSQTAFMIPLDGKTSDQQAFMSEEFLQSAKVATKQVTVPHRWLKTGRTFLFAENGQYIDTMRLIVVERKPETREWTEAQSSGTSTKDEGITAESKESIGFMVRINASAQIDEIDAVKFLYRYNNKPLAEVMDTEIRAKIESKFVEECAKLNLEDILANKEIIMKTVREDIIKQFKEKGVTITVIGLKGEFTYLNKSIQDSIDNKFKSAQALITQKNENERVVSKAQADAQAIAIQSSNMENNIKLKELENQAQAIAKWNGVSPTYMANGQGNIFNIPAK